MNLIGTTVRGIRLPIIREGSDLKEIVYSSIENAAAENNFCVGDKDIVGITESLLARAQGNYVHIDDIAKDIRNKFGDEEVGVVFPILSRNRFAILLKGIARAVKRVYLILNYPTDEVGNRLVDDDKIAARHVNPHEHTLLEKDFYDLFGKPKHIFTGVDYVQYYKSIVVGEGARCEVVFSNNPRTVLDFTRNILVCDIHTRFATKRGLKKKTRLFALDDILTSPISPDGGYNFKYGLLGSNKATEDTVKLFPRGSQSFVKEVQKIFLDRLGVRVEVLVYGDGAFKDPVGGIWELADPVVSPGFTSGLAGTPNEIKLKYLVDNDLSSLPKNELEKAIQDKIRLKGSNLVGNMSSQGTTPRRIVDLVGSLCDLTSGSGDKGTPVVHIQGYFSRYGE